MKRYPTPPILAPLLILALGMAGCAAAPSETAEPPSATSSASPSVVISIPPDQPGPGDHNLAIAHDELRRTYQMHAPPSYRPADVLPLVLVFHEQPGTGATAAEFSQMSPLADEERFLVAYPEGVNMYWRGTRDRNDVDDVGFISALIDHLVEVWGADPKRVYVTGFSDGADFTYRVARELTGKIAAAAPVSGHFQPLESWSPTIGPDHPVSLLAIQGTSDGISRSAFAGNNDYWRAAAGCGENEVTTLRTDAGVANRYAASCANGGEHAYYTVADMGHSWPDAEDPIDATSLIWEFFQEHPLP